MRSVKLGLLAAALLGATALTPAFADSTHTCQGNADCGVTNNDNDTTNNNGGKGIGIGVGIGVGKGGDAEANNNGNNNGNLNGNLNGNNNGNLKNVGNNYSDFDNKDFNANVNLNKVHNEVDNKNYNTNLNAAVNKNDIDVKNTNKNYNTDINLNSNKQGQDQDQRQKQGQLQGQAQSVENVGNVNIENERPPVNTAYSAALTAGEDTCMGSSSIGGQAVSFGLTIGTTWTDDNCQRLKNSRQLVALGYHRAATALMCFNEDVAAAMDRAGTPCPSGPAIYVAPPPPPEREYVPMAPVPDQPVKRKRRKLLPPK